MRKVGLEILKLNRHREGNRSRGKTTKRVCVNGRRVTRLNGNC